ncbi:MAG TPA: nuclear transport factor 2 family protein [Actinomycetota bacterium]|nr:nuclear transport factor 2 family protein [Actinomycetota bacterium]
MGRGAEEFLAETMPRLTDAEIAVHNGDAAPRMAMWARNDPVTLFGAAISGRGWAEVAPVFERLGSSFSNCTSYRNEVIAAGASGDLAYIAAFEHTTASVGGAPPQAYVLRVTTVFRREHGEWKVAHRHADPSSEGAAALAERLASTSGGLRGLTD